MTKEEKKFQPLTSKHICQIYELLVKHNLVKFPVNYEAINKVDALVSSINSFYFGTEIYKSKEEKALAYLYFLIKNHPFIDGNKRTASLAFEVICSVNDLKPDYSLDTLDAWAVFIEKIQEQDHQRIIREISGVIFKKSN